MFPAHMLRRAALVLAVLPGLCAGGRLVRAATPDPVLPAGVEAMWDLNLAYHETTPTRERICLNGLWQWQPANALDAPPPAGAWGYFKVPGCWPGITDYLEKDSQKVYPHPAWAGRSLPEITAAWYQRTFEVPAGWSGRRLALRVEYLNSYTAVFVDGRRAGEIQFPGGELDLPACPPGVTHTLALLVVAMPLQGVMLSYTDSASARQVRGAVPRRGLCGDVYLLSTPPGPRLTDLRTQTSFRRRECCFDAALDGLAPDAPYQLRAVVHEPDGAPRTFTGLVFPGRALVAGRMTFTNQWMPARLWDTDTPSNTCTVEISLLDGAGRVLDTGWPVRFGFREFWIDGRDFQLNGKRIFLSAVPLDNAEVSAATATYGAARESFARLKGFGINFVYTHNYGCEPGSHLGFEEILRAADDAGMLVALSQPHFSHYDWKRPADDPAGGYARHAEFYTRAAQNHPSVVMYSMSHNATGYEEDMNPDLLDGRHDVREPWAQRNVALALRAEAVVRRLDPGRIVYHHASGNLGALDDMNFYPNFVPAQELSDWFGHWAAEGVKPLFTCEYGAPFAWDWTMYRGWYEGKREWGGAVVPWEFCVAEWNAQFFGDPAYLSSAAEHQNLRWEAAQYQAGKVWHRWDYPNPPGSPRLAECFPVYALYLTDNWRAYRTWGVSGISPWDFGPFWKLRDGVDQRWHDLPVDWRNLQRPGFSPDYLGEQYQRMDLAFGRADWIATPAAEALVRNNRPLLAWLAGKPDAFTSKDHNFTPGETVEKQLIVINNSRQSVTCDCSWTLGLPSPRSGHRQITVDAGQQQRIPLRFGLPPALPAGRYELAATVAFSLGETQQDSFSIDITEPPAAPPVTAKIALFDPPGESRAWLNHLGVATQTVGPDADLSGFDLFIVGKSALAPDVPAPDIRRVRDGLKVLLFEQTAAVLEKRFGFRVVEYGLRHVFTRTPGHPALAGLDADNFADWRGSATLTPERLTYQLRPQYGPTVEWAGLPVTQAWRCGNRGNVASVLIEKPVRGDFLPLLDGGFSLQYSPLLEYHEGRGLVLFCQMDVTGRTEPDPAAGTLTRNLLQYIARWQPPPRRTVVYAGSVAGRLHLESLGLNPAAYGGGRLSSNQVLVLGAGGAGALVGGTSQLSDWIQAGGRVLAIGLNQPEAAAWLPFPVTLRREEHISSYFEPSAWNTLLAGIGPADVHSRAPRQIPLVAAGAETLGDGVLAQSDAGNVVFCQLEPWQYSTNLANLKRTFRRSSYLVTRLLANLGVAGDTPLLERFHRPVTTSAEPRWLTGFYLDQPAEWDDPYRFFRW